MGVNIENFKNVFWEAINGRKGVGVMGNRKETLDELFKLKNENEWKKYEDVIYVKLAGEQDRFIEKRIKKELKSLKEMGVGKFFKVLEEEYCGWIKMLPINRRYMIEMYDSEKRNFTDIYRDLVAFIYDEEFCEDYCFEYYKKGFAILEQINGVGEVAASGLLAIIHPKRFGIINSNVQEILNEMFPGEFHGLEKSALMEEKLLEISKELNTLFGGNFWTPRKVDKVLWSVAKNDK